MHNIQEGLSSTDSVESWIGHYLACTDQRLDAMSKKDRIVMALEAFYDQLAPTLDVRRNSRVVELSTGSSDAPLVRYFVENADAHEISSVLAVRDLYESFVTGLTEDTIMPGMSGVVKCVTKFGACTIGETYEGKWKQGARPDQLRLDFDESLPNTTIHPTIFYNKKTKTADIPKQFELLP